VLSSLDADPNVVGVAVLGAGGTSLYARGAALTGPTTAADDRIVGAHAVAGGDGRHGALVIELSTDRLRAARRTLIFLALVLGLAGLLVGVTAAWLTVRPARVDRPTDVDVEPELVDEQPVEPGDTGLELARHNLELEARVEARTIALTTANRRLADEVEQRGRIEIELRQAQKLESVGRLAAGVAHEINTPIQFVNDSCTFLQEGTLELVALTGDQQRLLEQIAAHTLSPGDALVRAREASEAHDLAYVREELPLAAARALHGLERVADIVRALKDFAYPDRREKTPVDLNRAIASTLTVARTEYKYVADVRTELADLPPVLCHLGELNQVVLNIVVNAAHAIETRYRGTEQRGTIAIATRAVGGSVQIVIDDDGCGIEPDVIDKIFDPFFTTKEIGKGTGQGLAIARSVIVDKHGGTLAVASVPGRGSTFTISLPTGAEATAA
jgi:signal transduction histidine kinase